MLGSVLSIFAAFLSFPVQTTSEADAPAASHRELSTITADEPAKQPDELFFESGIAGIEVTNLYYADQISLADDHFVIGVEVDGESRAYLETGMDQPHTHIAHDEVNGVNVAVTFCDRTGEARVFCGAEDELQDIRVGGWSNESMELLIDGIRLAQDSLKIKIRELQPQLMKWSEWKKLHPMTKLYIGDFTNALVQPKTVMERGNPS